MSIVQGLVDPVGNIVRSRGRFKVVSKTGGILRIQVTGQRTAKAIVQATPWRADADIGPTGVTASPDPLITTMMVFAIDDRYGLSFRIEP